MGRSRYKITDPSQSHFVTLTVLHWIPVFMRPATVNILLDSLRFLGQDGLKIYAWMLLENHGHFILQSQALDRDIARLKSWAAWLVGGLPHRVTVCIPTRERGNA